MGMRGDNYVGLERNIGALFNVGALRSIVRTTYRSLELATTGSLFVSYAISSVQPYTYSTHVDQQTFQNSLFYPQTLFQNAINIYVVDNSLLNKTVVNNFFWLKPVLDFSFTLCC